MRACTIEYLAPAVFDDLIEVYVRMAKIGHTSVTYELAAYRAGDDELMERKRDEVLAVIRSQGVPQLRSET